jgi:hypothetical protein
MKKLTLSVIALVLLSACGDSSTGSGSDDDSPTIPNLAATQLSFDYFKGKVAPELQQSTSGGYQLASTLTLVVESIMTGFTSLPASFMDLGNNQNASLSGDTWTWEYTSSGGGASVSIILTAVERSSTTDWDMLISASSPDISFNNYKFVDGSVSNSDNSGVWNFYDFEEQSNSPVLTYTWDIVSDNEMDFLITFGDFDYSTMSYVRLSPDNTIQLSDGANGSTSIYWNSDTGTGYYEQSGEQRYCWDATKLDEPC